MPSVQVDATSRSFALAALAVGIVAIAAAHVVNEATIRHRLLDMDLENNVPTWFSSSLFLIASLSALQAAGRASTRWAPIGWLGVAGLMLAFSIDETASLHEAAGYELGAQTTLSVAQTLAALAVSAGLVAVSRVVPPGTGHWAPGACSCSPPQSCCSRSWPRQSAD